MIQLALTLPASQWPEAPKKILLVGRNTEEAWALASHVLALRPETQEVAAIVNLGQPGADPSIDGLLKLAGWSRADLALAGAHLSVTATSRSSQWEPVEPGPAVWPPRYRLLLRWCTRETLEDKAPQPLANGATGVARIYCSLEGEDGLSPNQTKANATPWGCRVAWDHSKESVQPALRQRPPMSVREGPGDKQDVAMALRPEQVRSVVQRSGKHAGVEIWVGRPSPSDLTTTTVWVNLAAKRRVSAPVPWTKL